MRFFDNVPLSGFEQIEIASQASLERCAASVRIECAGEVDIGLGIGQGCMRGNAGFLG